MASSMLGRSSRNSRSLHTPHNVLRPVSLGHLRGERRLVLSCPAELFEGKRNRSDLTLTGIPHEAEKRPGVDASREKQAHLDIGEQMRTHAVEHRAAHPLRQFSPQVLGSRTLGEDFREIGERLGLARARGVDPLCVAGRHGADVAIERERLWHAAEQMEADEARRFEIARRRDRRQAAP